MEDQLAGLIRSMMTDQKENLLGKLAFKDKGKETKVVDDREPEYNSDQDFWTPPNSWPGQGGYMYELPV